jgi:hypothetical protein
MKAKNILLGIVLSILLIGNVSAYYFPTARYATYDVINSVVGTLEPILGALFGGGGWSGIYLFERLLLFIILASIIFLVLGKWDLFEKQHFLKWLIAVIIPLLGLRWIDYQWLTAILNQYQFLAIVLLVVFPFILYFLFLYNIAGDHGIIRKLGWMFFVGIYIGLWSGTTNDNSSAIYFWTMVGALICLFGDDLINRRFRAIGYAKQDRTFRDNEIQRMNKMISDLLKGITDGTHPNPKGAQRQIKDLERHIKDIRRL